MLYEILRALVGSDVARLADSRWVARALAWLEEAEGKHPAAASEASPADAAPQAGAGPDPAVQALLDEVAQLRAENEALRAKEAPE